MTMREASMIVRAAITDALLMAAGRRKPTCLFRDINFFPTSRQAVRELQRGDHER